MKIQLPEPSLVVLIGATGSGKSTFARHHFLPTEVISSDACRGLVCDDETDQTVSGHAFDLLRTIAAKRLLLGRLTVIDATNVEKQHRRDLLDLAKDHDLFASAFVFNLPRRLCHERNQARPDREFGPHVLQRQHGELRRSLRGIRREGFRFIHVFKSQEEVDAVTIERTRLWSNRREERGPFDIIGDVHGCCTELETLLAELGYEATTHEPQSALESHTLFRHPGGRRAIFLGDLVDRGPRNLDALRLVATMAVAGDALVVPGNHDMKFLRKLAGKDVRIAHGLARTLAELESLAAAERDELVGQAQSFLKGLVSHYVLDGGRLVVAHAGMKEAFQGRSSSRVRDFALYGETTGETDEYGLPVRHDWAQEYRGGATVVYGHTPVPEPEWLNDTINIDTGCVFGGRLTALRYPERELVAIPAAETYAESIRPFLDDDDRAPLSAQQRHDEVLHIEDVSGRRHIRTDLHGFVTIREENGAAALEVMSRFAIDPKWLIYLPPTMSPSETSQEDGLLEHPTQAFQFFRTRGVPAVVCEEKHMGSRAVVVVCRDREAAERRYAARGDELGVCYTRTGRRFFDDDDLEAAFLARIREAFGGSGLWDELETDWVCLDCELMPWSAKAQSLLRDQYAAVGAAARAAFATALPTLEAAASRSDDALPLLERFRARAAAAADFVAAYRRYCWSVSSLSDLKLAPFHILASEGRVHSNRDHEWHMQTIGRICAVDPGLLLATRYRVVDLTDAESEAAATSWWEEMTSSGGEGMVVKPRNFVTRGRRGLLQPALKCRGREYLRIIYGPDYDAPENLERLRKRGLGKKRSLALREFALGIEALERFVRGEPLRRVHECVFGVLALESEPVDPRL